VTELSPDVIQQENALLRDADTVSNTIGPMVLPLFLAGFPLFIWLLTAAAINLAYHNNPPLIAGLFNPAWVVLPIMYPPEILYYLRSGIGAWRAKWIEWIYWRGIKHTPLQLKIREVKYMGKANAADKGLADKRLGFIPRPMTEIGGDHIYEFWFASKYFPLAILCLPYTPEEMLNFIGNSSIVLNGGFIWGTDNVASVDFVRTGFTRTDEIPFVPIGVFGFYAKRALEISENMKEKLPVAVGQAAEIRDTFHATEWRRKYEDEKRMREKVESQETDIDKKLDERLGTWESNKQKGEKVHIPGKGDKLGGMAGLIVIVGIIAAVILLVVYK
jgi:hypothetical protein